MRARARVCVCVYKITHAIFKQQGILVAF